MWGGCKISSLVGTSYLTQIYTNRNDCTVYNRPDNFIIFWELSSLMPGRAGRKHVDCCAFEQRSDGGKGNKKMQCAAYVKRLNWKKAENLSQQYYPTNSDFHIVWVDRSVVAFAVAAFSPLCSQYSTSSFHWKKWKLCCAFYAASSTAVNKILLPLPWILLIAIVFIYMICPVEKKLSYRHLEIDFKRIFVFANLNQNGVFSS